MRRILWVMGSAMVVAASLPAGAQQAQRQLTGRVTAVGSAEPMAAASVSVVGTTLGAYTNDQGRFTLQVPTGAVQLLVRRVGFLQKRVDVTADQNDLTVALERDVLKLEELVITGQGTAVQRQNLANDVATVSAAQLSRSPSVSIEGALQGKIPGANIQMNSGAPGGGGQVQIRGITSITGTSDPLWVVDGVIVSNDVLNPGLTAVTRSSGIAPTAQDNGVNRIADLNPNDIERIEVLKGASAASIYGSRAANGVIVITTKKGEAGRPRYSVTQRFGQFQPSARLGSRHFTLDEAIATYTGTGKLLGSNVDSLRKLYGDGTVYDNEKNFFESSGLSYETTGSVSGGNETTRYFASGINKYDDGIMPNTGAQLQTLRLNLTQLVGTKLTMDVRTNIIKSKDRRGISNNDNTGTSPYVVFATTPSFFDLRPKNGVFPVNPFERSNPFETMALSRLQETTDRFIVAGSATYQALQTQRQTLQIRVDGGADRLNLLADIYSPPELQFEPRDALPGTAALTKSGVQNANFNASATHTFIPSTALQATTSFGVQRELRKINVSNIVTRDLIAGQSNVNRGTNTAVFENITPAKTFAFFGQEELLMFDERLLLTGGVRAERTTNNGDIDKMYMFPKASVSYRFGEFGAMDELKLRLAWGRAGNQPQYGQKFTSLGSTVYAGVNALRVGVNAGDPNIKPETQAETEGGFDATFFHSRLSLSFTAFDKSIDDLIIQPTFAPSSGFTSHFINGASLQNRGIEATVGVTPVRYKQGEWVSRVTYQKVDPKITELDVPTFLTGGFALSLGQYQIEKGKSPTQIVGLIPDPANSSGPPIRSIVGDATPDFQMAFDNEFTFGPFRLAGLVDWKKGGYAINLTEFLYDAASNSEDWTAAQKRAALQGKDSRTLVQKAGFLKVREISASYQVPKATVERVSRGNIRELRLGLSGRNLWTKTPYRGLDPEVSNFGNQNINRNVDVAPFPPSRSFFFTFDVGF